MKKRITESRVITKNVYKDYHLLKIHNGPSIQFKKSGNDYIVRVVTAPHTVDKNELKKMGFGTQSNTKSANDYNFTNGIQMNDVTLNKSQFEKLVSLVEKAYKAFIADIGDFYSRGKILDDVRGARRVNEGVRISLFDPNKNKILKTLSVDRNYREAEKEVETLNKRLSTSEKNKGYYWKITTIGESVNEDVSIKDGKYHFYSKDGLAHLTYNGKEIASGDFDFEGGNTYWLNHSSWKGQKAFDSGKEAIAYFKKNQIVNESGGTLKIEKGKDGKYYWEFKFNSGKVEKWPHGFDDKASAQKDFMYRMKYLSENSKDFNSFMKNVKQFESVNESKYNKDLDKIEAAVKNAKSFMGIGAELKKAGIKYDFSTSMIPMYMIKVPGNTIAVVNKKYAAGAEREVGDTAIGLLETKSIKESKFKSGDKVTVKYPTLVKPIKGVVSNILKGPDGDIVVLKGNNGVWDEKYVSLAEALTKSNLRNTIKSIIREETEYQQFFKKALEKAGKSIPDMSDEEKKAFFNKIDAAWKGKGEKNESLVNEYDKWYNTRIQAKNIFRMLKQKYSNNISKMKDGLEDILKQNKTKNDQAEVLRQEFNKYFKVKEELTGDQHKLDVDGDGEIEASDLAALRAGKKVDEGIWPKSKLPQSFQFALAPELKKNFKGIFYSVGNDIYHNDKKVLSVDGDRDSVNSIIKQLKSKIKESVNERYTGNSGDKLTHKYDKNIEIELIEPTNKGWKVYQTDKGNKRKIAYFDKQDIVGNKALFESVNESKINWKDFYTMAKDSSGYNPQFQKKYGKLLDRPHIVDALKKSKDFNSFVKSVKQFESVNEDNGNLMKIGSTMTVGGDGSGMIKPAKMKLISIDYLPNEKDYSYKFKGGGRTQYYMGSTLAKKLKGKSVNEVSYDSQGNLKVKKKYNALSDYEKVAKKGDYIWVGNNENDFKGAGKELLSKVLGKDSDGNVILSPFGRNKKHTISQKNQMVVVVEGLNEGATVFDERSFGKKGIIIMIDDNGKKVSAIFKDKKNADKYNRNNQSDIEALLKIAKTKPFGKAIDEAVNEGKKVFKVNTQIGKSKYSVSSHDGVSTHKDGSPFWDIKIFSNKAEMERGIADLKKQGYIQEALFRGGKTRNRSIKENATRTAAEIGSLTGMNKNFIQKFIDDNKLDIEKVFQYVKGGKTKDRMDFVTALSGKPGNTYQKKLIKMFGEGINEDCGCNSVNEVSIDAVRKNALNDKNTSNWKLDAGIKKRMQTRSQFGNLTSSNDVKFLTSPKVKVIDLGKDDVYIFTDGEREMIFRLPERGAEAYNFYKLKSLSKARPVVSTYYTDKVKD